MIARQKIIGFSLLLLSITLLGRFPVFIVNAVTVDGWVKDEFDNDTLVAWYNNTHRHDSVIDIIHTTEADPPDDVVTTVGVLDAGNLASLQAVDGDMYNVSETNADPAIIIVFNMTGLTGDYTNLHINAYTWYEGNPAHTVYIQCRNFTDGTWETSGRITEGAGMAWFNFSHVGVAGDFIENGNFTARIIHTGAGNVSHDIFIDYIELNLDVDPSGQLYSENMLVNRNSTRIVQFRYNITITVFVEEFSKISFSRDNSTWYKSDGIEGWESMTTGDNTILLTGLDWAGNFYYRVWLHADINGTSPSLDMVQISYQATPAGSSWNIIIVITVILSLLAIGIVRRGK